MPFGSPESSLTLGHLDLGYKGVRQAQKRRTMQLSRAKQNVNIHDCELKYFFHPNSGMQRKLALVTSS